MDRLLDAVASSRIAVGKSSTWSEPMPNPGLGSLTHGACPGAVSQPVVPLGASPSRSHSSTTSSSSVRLSQLLVVNRQHA